MGKASRKKEQQAQKASPPETQPPLLTGWLAQPWTVLFFLSLLAFLIYSKTFFIPFHFDDSFFIANNPGIRNFSSVLLSGSRYVSFLSFALNYHFGGLNVFGYHLVNLVIHITNGFLVYILIFTLFKTPRMQSSSFYPHQSYWIALITAFLFVAHPIQTMAVTYLSQRFASLATLFYLLAVVLYLKWRLAQPEARSRFLWYVGALLSTAFAMKTKEISFTLPFMLLLIEVIFFGSSIRKQWMTLIPFLLTLPIIPLSRFPEESVEAEHLFARETITINRLDYLFTQFRVILTYLRLLIFPVHQNLDYDYPIYHSLFEPPVFFSFLFLLTLLGLTLFLLFASRRSTHSSQLKLAGFGLFWFFLTLSIESSIIPIRDVIDEYRLYLPSVGFFLAGSVAVAGFLDRWLGMKAIAIGVVVAILSVATYQRNLIWKDDLTLWSDTVQKSPNRGRGHYNLGLAYTEQGNVSKALVEFKETVQLKPDYASAHNNLGLTYNKLGRPEEAIREFQITLKLKPDLVQAHNNLGNVYKALGRVDEAIQEYKTALALKPDYAEAHNNLGNVYEDLGRLDEAIQEFYIALKLKPDLVQAHNNLGNVYKTLGRVNEAIQEYKTALALEPDYAEAHNNLGNVYNDLGRLEEAIREFQIALKLEPDIVEVHYNLGQAYQHAGRIQEAVLEFEQALHIKPDYDPARQSLKSLHQ